MERMPQTYANHTKYVPMFHFVAFPVIAAATVWTGYRLFTGEITLDGVIDLLFKLAVLIAVVLSRTFALRAQDRVIRLEERLRIARLLSPEAQAKAAALTDSQLVGLRFATDADLPGLIDKTLAGNLERADIKKSIPTWRPDYHRL